jgi:branched-chain amino acid transport system ATP-binding protein
MHEAVLTVSGLRVSYGQKEILRGVDFQVHAGEVVTLLGANGSGKSSSLNAVTGLVTPVGGQITLAGKDVTGLPPHKTFAAGIVLVSQARDLFPDMSVEDNLRLGALLRRGLDPEAELDRVFGYFPRLRERRDQRARTMSGGEQQMLAVGRALMSRPSIMLLDEPSGGLSPQFVNEVANIMRRLKAEGIPMLIVEQNLNLAFAAADRFIILRDGEILEGGRVDALPKNHEEIVRTIYL